MEKLSTKKVAAVLRCLIEGNSVASTTRITGTSKPCILKILREAGEACSEYQDEHLRNLPSKTLQLDEIWSFVGCKEGNKDNAVGEHPGDVWTWTAICSDTKIIPSWRVGDRSGNTAYDFCKDLAKRFNGHLQITTDGHSAYRYAVTNHFLQMDFAQLVKLYGKDAKGMDVVTGIKKVKVLGQPDMDLVSTSYVERSNLTVRMMNRRFTRKTNAFSKKVENHCYMLAIGFMNYNFCRVHQSIKTTPAVAAGVSDKVWSMQDVAEMVVAHHAAKLEAEFAAAFSIPKFTAPRTYKAQEPSEKLLPWYLDPESGGPSPSMEDRKPGIRYQDGFTGRIPVIGNEFP